MQGSLNATSQSHKELLYTRNKRKCEKTTENTRNQSLCLFPFLFPLDWCSYAWACYWQMLLEALGSSQNCHHSSKASGMTRRSFLCSLTLTKKGQWGWEFQKSHVFWENSPSSLWSLHLPLCPLTTVVMMVIGSPAGRELLGMWYSLPRGERDAMWVSPQSSGLSILGPGKEHGTSSLVSLHLMWWKT